MEGANTVLIIFDGVLPYGLDGITQLLLNILKIAENLKVG